MTAVYRYQCGPVVYEYSPTSRRAREVRRLPTVSGRWERIAEGWRKESADGTPRTATVTR